MIRIKRLNESKQLNTKDLVSILPEDLFINGYRDYGDSLTIPYKAWICQTVLEKDGWKFIKNNGYDGYAKYIYTKKGNYIELSNSGNISASIKSIPAPATSSRKPTTNFIKLEERSAKTRKMIEDFKVLEDEKNQFSSSIRKKIEDILIKNNVKQTEEYNWNYEEMSESNVVRAWNALKKMFNELLKESLYWTGDFAFPDTLIDIFKLKITDKDIDNYLYKIRDESVLLGFNTAISLLKLAGYRIKIEERYIDED